MAISVNVINGDIHKAVAGQNAAQNSGHAEPGPVAVDTPPGGLAFPEKVTVQASVATAAGAGAPAAVKRESKRDDEFQRSAEILESRIEDDFKRKAESRESKFAGEAEILNVAQWQEVLNAIKLRREDIALHLVNVYADFLAKESNHSFLVTLLSKAIKTDSAILLQKILSLVPLKNLEKSFTFKNMMLPMAYALYHKSNRSVIQTLQLAGASMYASYASGPDLTAQVIARLNSGEPDFPYFAAKGHNSARLGNAGDLGSPGPGSATGSKNSVGLGNGFTPAFSQHRHSPKYSPRTLSPLTISFGDAGNPFTDYSDPYAPSADVSALSPYHASDLGRIAQNAAAASNGAASAASHSAGVSHGAGASADKISAQSSLSDFYVSDRADGDNGEYFYDPSPAPYDGSLQGVRPSEMVIASAAACDADADGFQHFGSGFSFSRGMGFESYR